MECHQDPTEAIAATMCLWEIPPGWSAALSLWLLLVVNKTIITDDKKRGTKREMSYKLEFRGAGPAETTASDETDRDRRYPHNKRENVWL